VIQFLARLEHFGSEVPQFVSSTSAAPMAFFRNRTVNRLNLHYGVLALAENAGGVFVFVYLLRAGVSVPATLTALAVLLAGRFAMRPGVLLIAKRWGLKRVLLLGTLAIAVTYPMLAAVHGVGLPLAVYCVVASFGGVLYWTSFHAYFAATGDPEHRGHQVGAREAIAAGLGIVAPLAGGYSLTTAGPGWTFAAVGVIQALGVLPLIGAPDVAIATVAPHAFRAARLGLLLFAADGCFAAGYYYIWQIALFVSVGQNFSAYGGALALAVLVGATGSLLLGRHIDAGHGLQAAFVVYGLATGVVILRAASFGLPWLAVAANAAGALVSALLIPALMTPLYNLAKASPCPLRFNIVTEGGWDIGCGTACLLAAGLTAAGLSLGTAVLLALPGTTAITALLSRYYDPASAAA
jgi:MFS transporter, DHA1 family, inner membrane transport protein